MKHPYGGYCVEPAHAPFSFNDFVLIGKHTRTDSNDKLYLAVYIDKKRNKLVYRIELDFEPGPVNNGGYGNIYGESMNWVKVPKPPADQEIIIEFVVL